MIFIACRLAAFLVVFVAPFRLLSGVPFLVRHLEALLPAFFLLLPSRARKGPSP